MRDLLAAIDGLPSRRILVLGDVILDRYTSGEAKRVSPEAPAVVLRVDQVEARLGGAAAVAGLLRALGAEVTLAGVVGHDTAGHTLRQIAVEVGIEVHALLPVADRPTTIKERFLGRSPHRTPQQILRVDHEATHDVPPGVVAELGALLTERPLDYDAVLISDYAKGVCVPELLAGVMAAARRHGLPVIVDPARRSDYARYRGASVVKPNRVEAELATGISIHVPTDAFQAGDALRRTCDCDAVVVTLDRDGMAVVEGVEPPRVLPAQVREVTDITGAGDTALASLGLALASGLPLVTAAQLAIVASGLQVERLGVAAITRDELRASLASRVAGDDKLVTLEQMAVLATDYRARGLRVVFTNGCFDLLHVGHVASLQEAAALGDLLVVAINSDASVCRLKGPMRPIVGERDRAALLAALGCVDHVLVFDDPTPHALLRSIRPDVLVKGGDYRVEQVVGREIVWEYGGQVRVVANVPGVSTTSILRRLAVGDASGEIGTPRPQPSGAGE